MNSIKQRSKIFSSSKNVVYDVLVIGGGINGAGFARESSLAGLTTILCEKSDFASGTSSTSSCMLHGGLRYLQYGKFKLVKEALHERNLLLSLCPEITKTQKFSFPIYKSKIFYYFIKLGMYIYDILAGTRKISKHKTLSKSQYIKDEYCIKSEGLIGSHVYFDALVNDSQLTVSTILTSVNKNKLNALNYAEVINYEYENKVWVVNVKDKISNNIDRFKAKTIVSCAGVWTNKIQGKRLIRPTKGIHITVKADILPIINSIVIPTTDNRIIFLNRNGKYVYIGTTDTHFSGDLNSVFANKQDINYLLNQVNKYISSKYQIKKTDIVSTWAGLRPLVAEEGSATQNTREEKIIIGDKPIISILGGKLTTFRAISQKVMILLKQFIQINYNKELSLTQTIKPYKTNFDSLEEMVTYHIENTMALKLEDIVFRRTNLYRYSEDNALGKIDEILNIMAKILIWNKTEIKLQKDKYLNYIKNMRIELE